MRPLVVVQARTSSTRLPNKVLLPLAGATLLERMLQRVAAARTPIAIVVATTTSPADDAIAELCARAGHDCFRGHPADLLDRHYRAARARGAEVVVKIPSDCPLIDPAAIDLVLGRFLEDPGRYDFVSNLHPATWPDGNDVEVMPIGVLAAAHREAARPLEREHTTPFVWERPERFHIGNVRWPAGRDLSMTHRFTIDYPEDYRFIEAVYAALSPDGARPFGVDEIVALCEARLDIYAKNARYSGVNWYRNHLTELRTVGAGQTRQDPST